VKRVLRRPQKEEEKHMNDLNKMTEAEIRAELKRLAEKRAAQYAYNKQYRKTHPLTPEQKDTRYAYSKAYRHRRLVVEQAIIARAKELGLLDAK